MPDEPLGWRRNGAGHAVITMTQDDWTSLILTLGFAGQFIARTDGRPAFLRHLALLNRLNEGNPNWTPYQVETEAAPHG